MSKGVCDCSGLSFFVPKSTECYRDVNLILWRPVLVCTATKTAMIESSSSFCGKSYFEKNNVAARPRVCVCVCMCVYVRACMCVSLARDSSETIKITIIKRGTVTASDMRMHHVLIIFTLTSIQGYTDLNRKNNKYSIIFSETVSSNAQQVCWEDNPTK